MADKIENCGFCENKVVAASAKRVTTETGEYAICAPCWQKAEANTKYRDAR